MWSLSLSLVSPATFNRLGAALKAEGYRSAAGYVSAVRANDERRGQHLGGTTDRAIRDAVRVVQGK